ncbi:hypothetical protein [Paraburkholderia sp. BCC1884]|uniref:hypothetical protein n=1 Tax=Paraburkholderia sp. BCC1884 TaxID=2562668 RepID=UPI0011823770|nr:hypothetical protein [Paraburkholderia sp. BCC1884]
MSIIRSIAQSCGFACALLCGEAIADTACNKQPVKAEHVEAIGRDMIVNGVPTSMLGLQFAATATDIANEFRDFWKQEGVPAKAQQGASGLFLSALDDTCSYVLTIPAQADGGPVKGMLSVIRLSGEPARHQIPDSALPLPDDGKVISDIESHDPGQAGRTWLIALGGRSTDNANRYRNKLAGQGWASVTQTSADRRGISRSARSAAVVMQRGSDRVDAIFSDHDGQTDAVVNATRNR